MTAVLERKRTGWDVALGILLILLGFFVLGNTVLATAVSVFVLAWSALFSGIMMLIAALLSIRSGFSWSVLLGGAVLTVLGLFMLRNPVVAAVSLTLMVGSLFFVSGVVRVGLAFAVSSRARWLFLFSGLVSLALGLWVLFNLTTATLTLIGVLLGVQVLVEGLTMLVSGRLRLVEEEPSLASA